MRPRTALIVGAGVGGLAAGIALRKAGWHARVFERAAHPRELGFALNLAPNAMAALRELGVAEAVVTQGAKPAAAELRGRGGRLLRRLNIAETLGDVDSLVALRTVLHGALLNGLGADALELNSDAIGFDVAGTEVTLRFRDGRSAAGDVLVGADGVRSIVRGLLHPAERPPRASGFHAIRGVAFGAEPYLGPLSAISYLARGIESAMVRAGQGAVYWYLSLLTEDLPSGAPVAEIVERSGRVLDESFRAVSGATRPDDLRLDQLFDRDPVDAWGSGPVTLLGDSAHPMLPHAGQGAAQALEDGVALGLALAPDGDVPAALRRYERVRAARTLSMVRIARRIARITTTKNPAIIWLREKGVTLLPATTLLSAFYPAGTRDPHSELR